MGHSEPASVVRCRLCKQWVPLSEGRVLIKARSDSSWDSVMFTDAEVGAYRILCSLGFPSQRVREICQDVFVCKRCLELKVGPKVHQYVAEQESLIMAQLRAARGQIRLDPDPMHTMDNLAALGYPEAFLAVIGIWEASEGKVPYVPLPPGSPLKAVPLLRNGNLRPEQLTAGGRRLIVRSLKDRVRLDGDSYYYWAELVEQAGGLLAAGLLSSEEAWAIAGPLEARAKAYLASLPAENADLATGTDQQLDRARACLEKARELRQLTGQV